MPKPQITATEYIPEDDLRDLLDEILEDTTVSYGEEQDLDLSAGIEVFQRDYEVAFGEFELSGFETITSLGAFVSLEGHLDFASSVVLAHALRYGVPTQADIDDELLETLRGFCRPQRPPVDRSRGDRERGVPWRTDVRESLRAWNTAVAEAGLTPRDGRCSDEELLTHLCALVESGEHPTCAAADLPAFAAP